MAAPRFDLILFDADDTLFDFSRCELAAFTACLTPHVQQDAHASAYASYCELSAPLWRNYERGELTLAELSERRWTALAQHCGLSYVSAEIAAAYLTELSRHVHLIDGAVDVCSTLATKSVLGLVTNGFDVVQRARLAASPLAPCFSFVVTSETAGAAKPSSLPFQLALELYARPIAPERVLMVGDKPSSDIEGGRLMGFTTCWFNAHGHAPPPGLKPDHTIETLRELLPLAGMA